jgi:hypothetical protein
MGRQQTTLSWREQRSRAARVRPLHRVRVAPVAASW